MNFPQQEHDLIKISKIISSYFTERKRGKIEVNLTRKKLVMSQTPVAWSESVAKETIRYHMLGGK